MPKFYRYVIYKLYRIVSIKEKDTPISNVVFLLALVHFLDLMTLYTIFTFFFTTPDFHLNEGYNKFYFIIFLLLFYGLHHLLFYNKKRFQGYVEEFKDETPKQNRKGTILVLVYVIGSILLFFITLILFDIFREWRPI